MRSKIKALIGETVSLDHEVEDDEDLLMSGVLDSISAVKRIARIEQDFAISIPATDVTFENFQSVNAMASYLEAQAA